MIKKFVIISLVITMFLEQLCFAAGISSLIGSEAKIKFGQLQQDEVWEGKIFLVGDVIVPHGIKLIIKPGTQLIFDERDIMEGGKRKDQCELIVYGEVFADATTLDPIQMVSVMGFDSQKLVHLDESVKIVRFSPYKIDTDSLKQEFRSFKHTYFILWAVIYGMWIFVRNI